MSDEQKNLEKPENRSSRLPAPITGAKQVVGDRILRVIPIRNAVLFPHNVQPLTTGKEWSFEVLENIAKKGGRVGVIALRNGDIDEPSEDDFHEFGTEAKVLKMIKLPDGGYTAVVHGVRRFKVNQLLRSGEKGFEAHISYISDDFDYTSLEMMALGRSLKQLVQKAVSLSPNIPGEANIFIENMSDPQYLADIVIPYLSIDFSEKQELLEMEDIKQRLKKVQVYLMREIEILEISQKIHSEVRSEVGKQQRKYYVREQLKQLQKELGELDGRSSASSGDPQDLREKIEKSKMNAEAKDAALKEIDRMTLMQPGSPEYTVSHTYVTWLLDLPWGVYSQKEIHLKDAKNVLDADHYGLEKIKKRILEFLAVYALKGELKGPIMLLLGPPGVGKTSLGRSIAKALGRKFARISLGGVRDEAEIRGHRRTYIGSMPGKLADSLKKCGTMDPVILLDEVDKLANDFRGDPASALLEVLDSEQNHNFVDHYLNVPLDLSKVLFICTANSADTIPAPLRDRMDIIEVSSYTLREKTEIAFQYLLPQVLNETGVNQYVNVSLPEKVMQQVIQNYCREAGVRQLRRELGTIARGIATEIVVEQDKQPEKKKKIKVPKKLKKVTVTPALITKYLGVENFSETKKPKELPAGVSTGLAYTPVGGDVLFIESTKLSGGSGKLNVTGQLGDVMKESVQTAMAYLAGNAQSLGIDPNDFRKYDVHLHVPAGAVKKDGPSAGLAIFLALYGLFKHQPLSSSIAVTGEISLRGEVLPVGGIKEKLLAAHRYGIRHVFIPNDNKKDLADVPPEVFKELTVNHVTNLKDAQKKIFSFTK